MILSLQSMGITPNDSLFIGDSLDDLQASTAAGFDFLAVASGITPEQKLKDRGAITISALSELPEFLQNGNQISPVLN